MILKTKNLTCHYQNGNLRYIKWGETEIIRMVYTAVRDALWLTATMTVFEEKIVQNDTSFSISYKAQYQLNDIDYQAFIRIEGNSDDSISFHFEGEAQSDFLRNRIGICVHHPIRECAGQPVWIQHTDGVTSSRTVSSKSEFPGLISPHQPFLNIQKMIWVTEGGIEASLTFEGDIFETEDQRNWTDGSYKTYSTPLSIPFPVMVKKGDKVLQNIVLKINKIPNTIQAKIVNRQSKIKYPFPKIGYARSQTPLTEADVALLKQVPFDHYRVECFFQNNWENDLKTAFDEARQLETVVELVVMIQDDSKDNWFVLKEILEKNTLFKSILLVGTRGQVPPQYLLDFYIPELKNAFPNIIIGAGTDAFFAELNRNRPTDNRLDFVAFSINPQVHLTDNPTLIENLEAQKYTLETVKSFFPKAVHITPVTLKWRYHPNPADNIDIRQHTDFIAQWTALSIKYLAAAESITFYETIGDKGLLNKNGVSPVFDILKKIKDFNPQYIIQNEVYNPLVHDVLILENGDKQLTINFKTMPML